MPDIVNIAKSNEGGIDLGKSEVTRLRGAWVRNTSVVSENAKTWIAADKCIGEVQRIVA